MDVRLPQVGSREDFRRFSSRLSMYRLIYCSQRLPFQRHCAAVNSTTKIRSVILARHIIHTVGNTISQTRETNPLNSPQVGYLSRTLSFQCNKLPELNRRHCFSTSLRNILSNFAKKKKENRLLNLILFLCFWLKNDESAVIRSSDVVLQKSYFCKILYNVVTILTFVLNLLTLLLKQNSKFVSL